MMIRNATLDDLQKLSELEHHINMTKLYVKILSKEILVMMDGERLVGWLRYSLFWDEHPFMNMLFFIEGYRG